MSLLASVWHFFAGMVSLKAPKRVMLAQRTPIITQTLVAWIAPFHVVAIRWWTPTRLVTTVISRVAIIALLPAMWILVTVATALSVWKPARLVTMETL